MVDVLWYLFMAVVGFLAGICNSIAGGGSFLSLPALFLFGLDPRVANGTNRVAVLFSSASAVVIFRREGQLDQKLAHLLTIPTIAGVPIGAMLAIYLPASALEPIFGAVFLVMAIILALNPKRIVESKSAANASPWKMMPVFLLIGIYVGFIQAGFGILLLIAMSLMNTGDLLASNAVKNWIGFWVTFIALLVFAAYGLVAWAPGLCMAVGNLTGGIVGAKLAIQKGNRLIFGFLIVVMVATGIKLIVTNIV